MAERPIIFSGPMVRAILDGRKTQTRRLVKMEDTPYGKALPGKFAYEVHDVLWVREKIRLTERWNEGHEDRALSVYCADDEPTPADAWPWKVEVLPSIHCPRGLSRITLIVTAVRVERLHEISEDDAEAEGVDRIKSKVPTHRDAFRHLWDDINHDRAPWSSNPYVWVVGFRRAPE